MLATCQHMSPQCQHFWLNIHQCQMSPMQWLDSWLGPVSADMLPHLFPAISMIHHILYLYLCIQYHFCHILTQNCTVMVQFSAKLCCVFFMPKRISWHVGKILADVLQTCHLEGWGNIVLRNVGPTFSTVCWYDGSCRDDMSFRGSWQHDTMLTIPTKDRYHHASIILLCPLFFVPIYFGSRMFSTIMPTQKQGDVSQAIL